jgi:ligand-binding sensor domain-containing protein
MPRPRPAAIKILLASGVLVTALAVTAFQGRGSAAEPTGGQTTLELEATPSKELDAWTSPEAPTTAALYYDRWETLTSQDGLPSDKVTTVLVNGDDLWVGTDRGIARRRNSTWTYWTEAEGLGHRYVTSLSLDPLTGDLWIATFGGLSHLSGGKIKTFTQLNSGLMNNVVYDVEVDGDLICAATAAGMSCLDSRSGNWALYDHENSIMHEPWCYALTVGGGRLWVGVWGGGIVELDRKTGLWREYRDPDKEMEIDLIRNDGPIHDVSAFVAWQEGVLWQATYFGLSRYDGRRWTTHRKDDTGLPGDFINHVAARGHTAFLGTDEGFGVFDGTTSVAYKRQADGRCEVTIQREGEEPEIRTLDSAPADNYVLWSEPGTNDVWVATGRGLSHGFAAADQIVTQ